MELVNGRVFRNASWIIVSKLLQAIFAFFIGILSARYLGPSNYGLINYAASLVTFAFPIAQLGLNNTLVLEFSQNPENEGRILGTSIFMSALSAVCCIVAVTAFSAVANMGDIETVIVVAIYSMNLLLQSMDLIQYWFQAKLLSKYSAIALLFASILMSCFKLFLLVTEKSIYWFAACHTLEYVLIATFLMVLYRKLGGKACAIDLTLWRSIFEKSRHYIIAGLMVAFCSQTDRIMLKNMIGDTETGYYSASVAIATVSSFVYVAIIDSFRPIIFSSKENKQQFDHHIKVLYAIIIWISFMQSVVMTMFADLFVGVLYGQEFAESSNILRVVVWFTTFSYLGCIRNIWMLAKDKQKYLWIINISGACLNIMMNWILIPKMGAIGASIASVCTQMFVNFIIGFVLKPIRENNELLIHSLNPKYIMELLVRKT